MEYRCLVQRDTHSLHFYRSDAVGLVTLVHLSLNSNISGNGIVFDPCATHMHIFFVNESCMIQIHCMSAAQILSGQQCATGGTGRQCATGGTWRPFIHRSSIHPKLHSSEDMSNLLQTMSPRIGRIGKRHRQHLGHRPAPPATCASEP